MPRKYVIGIAVLRSGRLPADRLRAANVVVARGGAGAAEPGQSGAAHPQHTQGMLDQTVEVHRLNAMRIDPRSPQHVRMMQTLSLQERSIDELAYVADYAALHQLGHTGRSGAA